MKYKLLKDLYDCFYTPPELPAQKQEIGECHHALSEVLGKLERRLVLQIIDAAVRRTQSLRKRVLSLLPNGNGIGRSFRI